MPERYLYLLLTFYSLENYHYAIFSNRPGYKLSLTDLWERTWTIILYSLISNPTSLAELLNEISKSLYIAVHNHWHCTRALYLR